MLTKVEIVTAQGTVLSLPLQDASLGYVVKDIAGLDPVKATITQSKFAQVDGTKKQSSSRDGRNIVIKLGYAPDYVTNDIRQLRNYLYQYAMPKSTVLLKFYMDDVLFVQISGDVESCEAPLFSKEPEVNISIINFQPDFLAPDSVRVPGNTVSDATEQVVNYPGSSETGIVFTLNLNRSLSEFMLYNRLPNGDIQSLEFVGPLINGDKLEIRTNVGEKGAWLTRAGVETPVLYLVSPVSAWVKLYPGVNNIRVLASGAAIPFTIDYLARYGGL